MSGKDRVRYQTETVLDQEFLDWSADNLENRLQMIAEVETPTGTIYVSDRNKYVDGIFYEALATFPVIKRTVGEWLAPSIQFSNMSLTISNVDGRFNEFLPLGANFDSWVGRSITVKLGLDEAGSTYTTVFEGKVTEIGGISRTVQTITLVARDNYEALSEEFPATALTTGSFPNLEDNLAGKLLPVIYGDFTVDLEPTPAIVPAYIVNGADPFVTGLDANGDPQPGTPPYTNIQTRIADHDLEFLDTTEVYLKRGDTFFQVSSSDITNVVAGNRGFEVIQDSGNTKVGEDSPPTENFRFESGDEFFVRVKGKDLGAYSDNIVWQARDILITYGGAVAGEFDVSWTNFRDKSSPSQNSISTFKSRVWTDQATPAIQYALSLLEQVRLEAFINRELKIAINSLHFDDWVSVPSFTISNFDVVRNSLQPAIDTRNNFNVARSAYDFHPITNQNERTTNRFRNDASITQVGRRIDKLISFPNMYVKTEVDAQTGDILRIASTMLESVSLKLTWRALLLDIGDFVLLNIQIGSVIYDNVPAMVREIGYDPKGIAIPVKLWSTALTPFPGYSPGYAGTVGGVDVTLIEET